MIVQYNIVFMNSRLVMDNFWALLCTVLVVGCGGSGTSPAVGLQPLNPAPPPATPQWQEQPVVLPNPNTYFVTTCMEPVIQFVLPTKLNDDEHTDFIVHYWCGIPYGGPVDLVDPTDDLLVAWASDGLGSYSVVNYEVFGDSYPELGSASRKVAVKDINDDGMPDFAFATNSEDGRLTGGADDQDQAYANGAYPTILLSGENFTYTINNIGIWDWGHAVDFAPNGDAVFAGYLWTADQQAFRLQDNEFVDVSNEYPLILANAFRFGTEYLVNATVPNGINAIELWQNKTLVDVWLREPLFSVDVSGVLTPVVNVNGMLVYDGAINDICVMDINDVETFVFHTSTYRLKDGSDLQEGYNYNTDDFSEAIMLEFFQVENNALVLKENPLEQTYDASFNFFTCTDINNDGLDDIQIQKWSGRHGESRETGGIPDVFLQHSSGFDRLDTSDWPTYSTLHERTQRVGDLYDINSDGFADLILYESDVALGDIEIYLGNKDL